MELRKCSSDQTVQRGYALGTPFDEPFEWTSLQGGNMMWDMDPHYAYFGCNTESQVKSDSIHRENCGPV